MCAGLSRNGDKMGVSIYVLVTIAVFAVLGLAQKLVERL
ncbi:potassium ABC transporter ATPase [Mycobacterium interjectum]|nr:potassium ABC transporter ATPase [Mycobacterium interjectum]